MHVAAKRILVVDDHPGIVATLKVAFRLDGERFVVADAARTAADGMAMFDRHDAVLLDLQLPDAGGPEMVHRFRAAVGDAPVVLHTAGADMQDLGDVADTVDAILMKGELDTLLATLARVTQLA
jgi:CheY-like chemotaxis protein